MKIKDGFRLILIMFISISFVITMSCKKKEAERETIGEIKTEEKPVIEETDEAYVSAGPLNLRSQPSLDGKIITVLGKDMPVKVLEKSDTQDTIDNITAPWYRVRTETGDEGWVFGGYIEFGKPAGGGTSTATNISFDLGDVPNGMPAYDYYKLGKSFYDEKNFKKSLPYLLKSLETYEKEGEKGKQYGWALFFAGACYQELGDHNKAIDMYKKALQIMPDYFWLHNNIGLSYIRVRNREKAIEHLERAVELAPGVKDKSALDIAQQNLDAAKSMH
ncbi:MAG: hypothetical protein B6D57_03025 [Candidatus Coatesbacteria bacterium 4484_99]|uniref:SH3b domain-containing protein n=1 Tax=Candidatus Coatesbacteria bacterium 4484_99 TaxID=1970774 RepID=A0A1W9S0T7_9BACT|nr:MAG: hypothetical protein B6D57_03025 [Candidatus Coatesbacteria bacterium 4484_99]RLC41107.1 MAG: hypothetical protein DRH51_03950 [Candidatus Coatesbacteria bacterium]RLC43819.1 MAG: hypothetical protein DRH49_00275 [Candidatus Coatesbacteria bacterium]RLC45008.1 MAG: hypothetical protein DRH44_00475 [Candidatus Coatesbacteria bacterium]